MIDESEGMKHRVLHDERLILENRGFQLTQLRSIDEKEGDRTYGVVLLDAGVGQHGCLKVLDYDVPRVSAAREICM